MQFVAGILTQQVELNDQRLEIGIVTEASFVRETIGQLDRKAVKAAGGAVDKPALATTRDAVANVGRAAAD